MLEGTHSRYIGDHSDALVRIALLDTTERSGGFKNGSDLAGLQHDSCSPVAGNASGSSLGLAGYTTTRSPAPRL
jgi:hypothetical protein